LPQGHLEFGGVPSDILQKVELNITRGNKNCEQKINGSSRDKKIIFMEQICANGGTGKDACSGDSGGKKTKLLFFK
jgi:secreted trypsin-like serine protease